MPADNHNLIIVNRFLAQGKFLKLNYQLQVIKNMRNPVPVTLEKTTSGKKYLIKEVLEAGSFQRVLDFGIVPGAVIEMIRTAPLGDPVQFKARGFHFSLRKEEARHILVEVAE